MRNSRVRDESLGQHLLYLSIRFLCAFAVILVFLTLVECTIKKPEAPTWQTNWVLPLSHKTWDMPLLIEKLDQDNLTTDSLGNPLFFYSHLLDTITNHGSYVISDFTASVSDSLGTMQLDSITGTSIEINISDIFGAVPSPYSIPDTSFGFTRQLPPIGDYTSLTVSSGLMFLTINNNLGLDLDTVLVSIQSIDAHTLVSSTISTHSISGGIPAGGTAVDTINLAGKTISNLLGMVIHAHTTGGLILSASEATFSSGIDLPEGLSVSQATAKIPSMTRSFSDEISLDCEHQLETATISSGRLVLNIANHTNLSGTVTITLPDMKIQGIPLTVQGSVAADGEQQIIRDLSGYDLELSSEVQPQPLTFTTEVVTNSSGESLVDVSSRDSISVVASIEDINLSYIEGIIAPTTIDFDNIQQAIDLPKGFDSVQLTRASISLDIINRINVPAAFTADVIGDGGQHLVITGNVAPGTPESPVTTVIVDSNAASFLNPVPELITVSGIAVVGDGATAGSMNSDDYIIATLIINAPLAMNIHPAVFDGDCEGINLDIDSGLVDGLKLAHFYATAINGLPIDASIEFLLSSDSVTLYSDPEITLGPVTVNRGALNPDGTVASATTSEAEIIMDSAMIQILHSDTLWVGERIIVPGTNDSTVLVTARDSLTINSRIEAVLEVSKDIWEDD